jgi:hypothetical protein
VIGLPLPIPRATDGEEEARREEEDTATPSRERGTPQTYPEFCEASLARITENLATPDCLVEGDL